MDQVHGAVQPLRRDRRRPRRPRAPQTTRRHPGCRAARVLRTHRKTRGGQLRVSRRHHRDVGRIHPMLHHQLTVRGRRQELDLARSVRGKGGVRRGSHRGKKTMRPARVLDRYEKQLDTRTDARDHRRRHGTQDHG